MVELRLGSQRPLTHRKGVSGDRCRSSAISSRKRDVFQHLSTVISKSQMLPPRAEYLILISLRRISA